MKMFENAVTSIPQQLVRLERIVFEQFLGAVAVKQWARYEPDLRAPGDVSFRWLPFADSV